MSFGLLLCGSRSIATEATNTHVVDCSKNYV